MRIMKNLVPTTPVVPDFTPVPRKRNRYDGWTPERQRGFIEALAELGSVIAEAQREWEAAARPETWAAWKARGGRLSEA